MAFVFQANALTEAEMESRLKDLFNQFRCPTCQGLSVKDSEAGFSVQIRNKIEEMLQSGATDDEIRAYFVERYGEWILRSPPKRGFNLLLWILPALGMTGGMAFLFHKSRQWAKKQEDDERWQDPPLTTEEENILEKDLRQFQNR